MRPYVASLIMAAVLAGSVAVLHAAPQAGEIVAADAVYLEAAAVTDDSQHGSREQADTAAVDREMTPLFGMATEPVADGDVAEKWRAVEAEIGREQEVLARCRAQQDCPVVAQGLLDIVAEGADQTGRARVGLINRAVDLAIKATSDEMQWGVDDRWSSPFETLRTGQGDCEDYAIVKYIALLQAGLSRDDVKIVILRNLLPNEAHAAVAARVDGQWLILDNRWLALVPDADVVRSIPEFVLDEGGARRFVASAAGQGPGASQSTSGPVSSGRFNRLHTRQERK
jgi:predicted transglutaminase-like cysteine proteinase